MGSVVLDADVVIGFLDAADANHSRAVATVGPWLTGDHHVSISASVYTEILVRPLRSGTAAIVDDFVDAVPIEVVATNRGIARRAAELRATHRTLRLPDALSLATALQQRAEFLTLDAKLRRIAQRAVT